MMNFVTKYQKPLLLSTIGLLGTGILVGTFYLGQNSGKNLGKNLAAEEWKTKLAHEQEELKACQEAQTNAPKQPPKSSVTNTTKPSQPKLSKP